MTVAPELAVWVKATAAEQGENTSAFVEGILTRSMKAAARRRR